MFILLSIRNLLEINVRKHFAILYLKVIFKYINHCLTSLKKYIFNHSLAIKMHDIIEIKTLMEGVWKVSSIVFVGYSSQASKSVTKSAENCRPIIPLVGRAGRSHVRIVRPVGKGRESFEKFADHDQLVRLVLKLVCNSVYVYTSQIVIRAHS